jgi:hypothetical protein
MAYSNPAPTPAYPQKTSKPVRRSYIPHPKEYLNAQQGPVWGALGAMVGGALIAVYGAYLAFAGPLSAFASTFLIGSSLSAAGAGSLLFAAGVLVALLGTLSLGSSHNQWDGGAIWLLLFILGLAVTGVGFYLVSLLAGIGAAHIYWWKPNQIGGAEGIRRARG